MKMELAENIRRFRKARGLTQEQLSEALGVTAGAVYKWETGRSTPEIGLIMEMADFFETSVDVLLGYSMQSNAIPDIVARIQALRRKKAYSEAFAEVEKALRKYPNDFRIVYHCAVLYQLAGVEAGDCSASRKAIALLERSLLLLSQNTDPAVSEFSIRTDIAESCLALGQTEKGLELLKENNLGGIHNARIGYAYSAELQKFGEAAPYLAHAFMDCCQKLIQAMVGYANLCAGQRNAQAVFDTLTWLIGFLDSIKADRDRVTFIDKLRAAILAQCAAAALQLGREAEAGQYLREAYIWAERFDAAPVYGMQGIRFCLDEGTRAVAYDNMGSSAMAAVEKSIREGGSAAQLQHLWEELKNEP